MLNSLHFQGARTHIYILSFATNKFIIVWQTKFQFLTMDVFAFLQTNISGLLKHACHILAYILEFSFFSIIANSAVDRCIQANPTSFSLISHNLRAFSTSLASLDSWFWNEDEFLFQLQYTPDCSRLESLTTCASLFPASSSDT